MSILCGLTALTVAGNRLFFAVKQEASQIIRDYVAVADPAVLVLLSLTVLVNLRDSLQARNRPGTQLIQLPQTHLARGGVLLPACNGRRQGLTQANRAVLTRADADDRLGPKATRLKQYRFSASA